MAIKTPEKKPSAMERLAKPLGSALGGAVGFVASGFNPAGAAAGAGIGGGLGEAATGISKGDAGQALGGIGSGAISAGGLKKESDGGTSDVLGPLSAMRRRLNGSGQWKLGNFNLMED